MVELASQLHVLPRLLVLFFFFSTWFTWRISGGEQAPRRRRHEPVEELREVVLAVAAAAVTAFLALLVRAQVRARLAVAVELEGRVQGAVAGVIVAPHEERAARGDGVAGRDLPLGWRGEGVGQVEASGIDRAVRVVVDLDPFPRDVRDVVGSSVELGDDQIADVGNDRG